jgi:hypothetical protein
MCTGAREKNGNMPLWHVAYSHFTILDKAAAARP